MVGETKERKGKKTTCPSLLASRCVILESGAHARVSASEKEGKGERERERERERGRQ